MAVAFVLTTMNVELQHLRFQKNVAFTLNGTNNTQMLHYQHEDDLSHMVYYISKPKLDMLFMILY